LQTKSLSRNYSFWKINWNTTLWDNQFIPFGYTINFINIYQYFLWLKDIFSCVTKALRKIQKETIRKMMSWKVSPNAAMENCRCVTMRNLMLSWPHCKSIYQQNMTYFEVCLASYSKRHKMSQKCCIIVGKSEASKCQA